MRNTHREIERESTLPPGKFLAKKIAQKNGFLTMNIEV